MIDKSLAKKIEADIFQKIDIINTLVNQSRSINNKCIDNFLKSNHENETNILDQAINDAILNSMATLIDYYCIYCMINIGIPNGKIRQVQYHLIGKKHLIDSNTNNKEEKKTSSLDQLKKKLNDELSGSHGLDISKLNPNHYWIAYLAGSISRILERYGVPKKNTPPFKVDQENSSLIFDSKIEKYHQCMQFLYCNPAWPYGVRYNIYIDINNCLKHNSIPRIMRRIERFTAPTEKRIFTFFEIHNYKLVFLKDGFLRDLLDIKFEKLKSYLEQKNTNNPSKPSPLEQSWEIGSIIRIDKKKWLR